jgi:hypothetical protein
MQKIPNDTSFIAEWRKPKALDSLYELRCENLYLGSLDFQSPFTSIAFAETADGKWSFKRAGICNRRVTIREQGKQENIAICDSSEICFNDGKTYVWKGPGFWSSQWEFIDSNGEVVMTIEPGVAEKKFSDLFKTQATIEIYPSTEMQGNITVLLPLAFYLLVLQQRDAAG